MEERFVTYDGKTVTEEACLEEFNDMLWKIIHAHYDVTRENSVFDAEDLLQECRIRLLKAARTYDPTKGAKFITYAYQSCTMAVRNYFRDYGYQLKVNHYTKTIIPKMRELSLSHDFTDLMSRAEEFAATYELPLRAIREAIDFVYGGYMRSIDTVASGNENDPVIRYLPSKWAEQDMKRIVDRVELTAYLEALNARERFVVLAKANDVLNGDIAQKIDRHPMVVGRIYKRAISKMQHVACVG